MHRIALITGGTRGIGLGIAQALARAGYDLALNGVRDEAQVTGAIAELEVLGAQVVYCRGDVSDPQAREAILRQVQKSFGTLHVLVNNAGVAPLQRADITEATETSFDRVLRINLQGPYFLTQAVADWMIRQQAQSNGFTGCIIFVTSISARLASVNRGEYCISKAGLSMAAKLWAVRLGEFGLPVYEVRPGVIHTDMTAAVQARYDGLIADSLTVEGRWGEPDDVGRAVAALVRGDLPYSTGQVLTIDGGLTLPRL